MRIYFNGAARTVTGSQHFLEINGYRLLLECGLFQGRRKEAYRRNLNFEFDPKKVDAVILSHAHIDHSGNLPNLVKQGFNGNIYMTPATGDLADLMLRDSGHIQESDIKFVNKRRRRKGESLVEPIYTVADAENVKQYIKPISYEVPFEPIPGVTAKFVDAGHILGSAAIVLDVEENNKKSRLWFSGDIGRLNLPLLEDPILPERADYLIMESTYGDKNHRDPESAFVEFRDVVRKTIEKRGKVIVPAFAVGRTQELVYCLNRLITEHEIPEIPVYVDSPLAVNATKVFRKFPELFDDETHEFIRTGRHPALMFDQLTYVGSVEESKSLNYKDEPMVIISASGMAEAGRILHHLRNNIEDEANTIVIVGWQAPYTLGRRLADREPKVRIFGEEFVRRAEVETIGGLSAHAGRDFLVKYAKATQSSLKDIFLVHGEPRQAGALCQKLRDEGINNISYPDQYDVVDL